MERVKSVLLLTYYWPPSGGAGVQRWLKLVKYLDQLGVKCTVITVDDKKASYPQIDESLCMEIPDSVRVFGTNTIEPYSLYKRFSGSKQIPYGGFVNEPVPSFRQKIGRYVRANFFIPDPRKGWNKSALKQAKKLISEESFDAVITTSPPHSTQLIGRELKRELGIRWIADLRDPWTDIYYYKEFPHSKRSARKDANYEKSVLLEADEIIVVSDSIKKLFADKIEGDISRITVIPNGYDASDFEQEISKDDENSTLKLAYTGTLSDIYTLDGFFEGTKSFDKNEFHLNFTGKISEHFEKPLSKINHTLNGYVPHSESVKHLMNADILLLVIPEIENNEGILTGKLFEYLGSRKPILMIGPINGDAANIIRSCNAGAIFDYQDSKGIRSFIQEMILLKQQNKITENTSQKITAYSRKALAETFIELI
ncbi:MAG: glycosyltransferase [Crocinitomicaceae bacterium]|nr:glycosyltransferase [Crocinitomicaceae bacterium]